MSRVVAETPSDEPDLDCFVNDWLVVGPIDRTDCPMDPLPMVQDPTVGKVVEFIEGKPLAWRSIQADASGVVRLESLPDLAEGAGEDKVFYAYCEFAQQPNRPDVIQVFLGMDDGGRMWVDGDLVVDDAQPGWYFQDEHKIAIETHDNRKTRCLLEVHNWTGGFCFSLNVGYTLKATLRHIDGQTPFANQELSILSGAYERQFTTDNFGRFESKMMPYGRDFSVQLPGRRTSEYIRYDRLSQSEIPNTKHLELTSCRSLQLEVGLINTGLPAGRFTGIDESLGEIVAANSSDNSLYVWDGTSWQLHPNRLCHQLADNKLIDLEVSDQGTLWVASEREVIRVIDDRRDRWEVAQFPAKIVDIVLTDDGVLWAATDLGDDELPGNLYRIDHGTAEQVPLESSSALRSIDKFKEGIIAAQKTGPLLVVDRDGTVTPREIPGSASEINSVAVDSENKVWLIGNSIYTLDLADQWSLEMRWLHETGIGRMGQVVVSGRGNIWVYRSSDSTIYCKQGENWYSAPLPKSPGNIDSRLVCSKLGTAYVTSTGVGVVKVRMPRSHRIDIRDGIAGPRCHSVSPGRDGIYFSTEKSLGRWTDAREVDALEYPERINFRHRAHYVIATESGDLALFENLSSKEEGVFSYRLRPYWRPDGGEWRDVDKTPWGPETTIYHFASPIGNNSILVGTERGLFTLKEGHWSDAGLLSESRNINLAIKSSMFDGYWMTEWFAGLHKVIDGEIAQTVDFPIKEMSTSLAEFGGQLWIGRLDGLYRFDISTGNLSEYHSQTFLKNSQVVDMAVSDGLLWVATARQGLYTIDLEGNSLDVGDVQHLVASQITDLAVADNGDIWLGTTEGPVVIFPDKQKPSLGRDRIAATRVHAKSTLRHKMAGRDDSASLHYRYRIDGEPWQWNRRNDNLIQVDGLPRGEHCIEYQCTDSEHNFSEIQRLHVTSYLGFFERLGFQLAVGGVIILLALLASISGIRHFQTAKKLLAQQREARERAELATRERELLLARVCHDLRSPISVARICTGLISGPSENADEIKEILTSSTDSMSYLTDQLLNYSKSSTDVPLDQETPTVIRDVFHEIRQRAMLRFKESGTRLELSIESDAPPRLVVDRQALLEALTNLVDNAFRHTMEGMVRLEYAVELQHIELRVRDNGSGIAPAALEMLFHPFVRGTKDKTSSVGLGMTICKRLTEKMGGEVRVTSDVSVGTCVTLQFPLSHGMAAAELDREPVPDVASVTSAS